jgi:hypothetical protein
MTPIPTYANIDLAYLGPGNFGDRIFLSRVLAEGFTHLEAFDVSSAASWDDVLEVAERISSPQLTYSGGENSQSVLLHREQDNTLAHLQQSGTHWALAVASNDAVAARRWVEALSCVLPEWELVAEEDDQIPVWFWTQDSFGGASGRLRLIRTLPWDQIQTNYPSSVRSQLERIMRLEEPDDAGKLILFHGPPGTGKTRSILSLFSEWQDWCVPSVVTDPERFFGNANYLNDLLFNSEDHDKWLLIVIEDGDEFLNVDEKTDKGQSIGRLLNVADGIVGQGLRVLTLMTTNVEMEYLNPAVVRTGRCMANLQFPTFDSAEAAKWLSLQGSETPLPEGLESPTLAELYGLLR